MRRPFAALLLGAVSLAAVVPVAAGAAEAPAKNRNRMRLQCEAVRQDAGPAVACRWSAPRPELTANGPLAISYRLWRAGGGDGRHEVYRGPDQKFLDPSVHPGGRYAYLVQAVYGEGKPFARSNVVTVKVPRVPRQPLKLACELVRATAAGSDVAPPVYQPAVDCKWSDSSRRHFVDYRLFRADGKTGRQVVYRGKETHFADAEVASGHRYRYLVQALDADGHVIGSSGVASVAVPPYVRPVPKPKPIAPAPKPKPIAPAPKPAFTPEPKVEPAPEAKAEPAPEIKPETRPEPKPMPPTPTPKPEVRPAPKPEPAAEPLKLACAARPADGPSVDARPVDGQGVVVCEWSAATHPGAAGYRLWRGEREGGRAVVFKSRDATRFTDTTVSAGHGYVYLVQAVDASGRVIGTSEPVKVLVPGNSATS